LRYFYPNDDIVKLEIYTSKVTKVITAIKTNKFAHSGTIIKGKGMNRNNDISLLTIHCLKNEVLSLIRVTRSQDPDAFFVSSQRNEVDGWFKENRMGISRTI
jgi:uncharacterized membrane-anchored protein YitT (DUF2179 family)